jgi:hypothetical protein
MSINKLLNGVITAKVGLINHIMLMSLMISSKHVWVKQLLNNLNWASEGSKINL